MKTRVSLKYFLSDPLWKQFLASNSPQIPSNLISLTILVTLRKKIERLNCRKVLKFALFDNCFSDIFSEVEIWY